MKKRKNFAAEFTIIPDQRWETDAAQEARINSRQRLIDDLRRRGRVDQSLKEVTPDMLELANYTCPCGGNETHHMVSFVTGNKRRTICPYLLMIGWMRLKLNGVNIDFDPQQIIDMVSERRTV